MCDDSGSSDNSMAKNPHGVPRSPRVARFDASGLSMPPSPTSHRPTEKRITYVHELPFNVHSKLCKFLDADKKWDTLAGLMHMDRVDIKLLRNTILRGDSPAEEVLRKFGERNGRISQVFKYLSDMEYYKGMDILKGYVHPRHWHLLGACNNSGDVSSTLPSGCFEPPSAPPYESEQMSMKPKLQLVSAYSPRKESHPRGHNSHKLSSPTAESNGMKRIATPHGEAIAKAAAACATNPGKAEMDKLKQELLSSGIKVLSIKTRIPQKDPPPGKLHKGNVNAEINFKDIDLEPIKHIPYVELADATQDFAENNVLGKGGFGTVYRGSWKDIIVAVKKLRLSTQPGNREHIRQMLTELRVLEKCRFPHILALYGVSIDNMNEPCIVYEFMPGGSLDDRLKRKQNFASVKPLTWQQRASIARGTARGLNYLHTEENQPLVHGDIKPANILLDANLQPKLGDFGLTREGPEGGCTHRDVSRLQGTKYYLPHEYLHLKHLSTKVDVYSFGLVLLELATNLRISDDTRRHRFLSNHMSALKAAGRQLEAKDPLGGDEPGSNDVVELFVKLGLQCSAENKKYRPEMSEVLEALKDAAASCKSSPPMATGYSREPTATMHHAGTVGWAQGMWNGTLAVPQNWPEFGEIRRLSPSDNLQVGPASPVPPTCGTAQPTGTANNTAFLQSQQTPKCPAKKALNFYSPPHQQQQGQLQMHHLQKLQNAQYQHLLQQQQQQQQQQQKSPPHILQQSQVPHPYVPFVQPQSPQRQQHATPAGFVNSPGMLARPIAGQPQQQVVVLHHDPAASNTFADEANCGPSTIASSPSNNNNNNNNNKTTVTGTNYQLSTTTVSPGKESSNVTTASSNVSTGLNAPTYEMDLNCLPLVPALSPEGDRGEVPKLTMLRELRPAEDSTTKSVNTTNNSISTSDSSADNSPN